MGEILVNASRVLSASEKQAETIAHNIANVMTPGFKGSVSFETILSLPERAERTGDYRHFSPGPVFVTDEDLDFSIEGPGFFVLSREGSPFYTRNGQFVRNSEGFLSALDGSPVLSASNEPIRLSEKPVEVSSYGDLSQDGELIGRLAVVEFADVSKLERNDGATFTAGQAEPVPSRESVVRQGMLEGSNVNTGEEMVELMAAMRRAEAGQRLIQTYDEMLGRVITTLGQG